MLKVKMKLIKVDYESIAKRFIPDAFHITSESSSLSMRIAGKLLVKDGETSTLAKEMMKLIPQQVKDSLAYSLVLRNQERFSEAINKSLAKELSGIQIDTLRILPTEKAVYDMIKFEMILKEIDYNLVVEQLLPKLFHQMSEQGDKSGKLAQVFLGMGDAPNKMLTAAFDTLTKEAKDELLVSLFTIYSEDIVHSLNRIVEQQQISAEISEINFKHE